VGRRFVCGFDLGFDWDAYACIARMARMNTRRYPARPRKSVKRTKKTRRDFPRRVVRIDAKPDAAKRQTFSYYPRINYLAFSAEFDNALPPFEISWPAPAMVLQPESAATEPAMRSKAISRVMKVLLCRECIG
jgi:hypothetical protein